MIVKFDHISYSCSLDEEKMTKDSFEGYEVVFYEKELTNLPIKQPYMRKIQTTHNIMLLQKKGMYPVEITAYADCPKRQDSAAEKYVLKEDVIEICSADPEKTEGFYKLLGLKKDADNLLTLKPLLDEKTMRIRVMPSEEHAEVSLDETGYSSLAFVVDNAKKQKQLLEENDIAASAIEELIVNGKKLKIFFTKSPSGEIIEFIGLR